MLTQYKIYVKVSLKLRADAALTPIYAQDIAYLA